MADAKISSVTLVKTWLEHYTGRGLTKQTALDVLNQKLGTVYAHGHLSRWERGIREPNADARTEMLRVVLPRVLKLHGRGGPKNAAAALEKLR